MVRKCSRCVLRQNYYEVDGCEWEVREQQLFIYINCLLSKDFEPDNNQKEQRSKATQIIGNTDAAP